MKEYYIRMTLGHNLEVSEERLEQFVKYHNANEDIWKRFKRMAHEVKRYSNQSSSKHIFELVRHDKNKHEGNDGFKLNNNYTSIYSRLLEAVDPDFIGFFRYRGIKSQINDSVYDRENDAVYSVVD